MLRLIAYAVLLIVASAFATPTTADADEIVRYQLTDWKAKHIHDAKKAETISATLKKLGCELQKDQHKGAHRR